jgi:hypothetical protein
LALLRDELLAMPPAAVLPVNIDVFGAAMTVLAVLPLVTSYEPALTACFGVEQTRCIARLEPVARAALAAHARWTVAGAGESPGELARRLMTIRDTLRTEARALVLHGVLHAGVLRELVGGKAFDSLVLDVLQLTTVFQTHRDAIAGRSGIDERYLARAEQLVDDMATALGHEELRPKSDAAELRDRAFSLMAHTYDDVRRLISYLRWKERDAEQIAPSLYANRTRRSRGRREARLDAL